MMRILGYSFNLLCCLIFSSNVQAAVKGAEKPMTKGTAFQFHAKNPLAVAQKNAAAYISLSDITNEDKPKHQTTWLTKIKGQTVPNQLVDSDFDGVNDALLFIHDYLPSETIRIELTTLKSSTKSVSFQPRTQAEMGVRVNGSKNEDGIYKGGHYQQVDEMTLLSDHRIGNKLFRYEGFGWESSKVGYRYYFDERATIDIFGKKTKALILQDVGHDGTDYHKLNDWGMDILKVGPSLGIGSLAAWYDKKIIKPKGKQSMSMRLNNGALSSQVVVKHKGWQVGSQQVDLQTSFSILADSRLTHVRGVSSKPLQNWVTGIVKHGVERLDYFNKNSEWNYIATYGRQSLADDDLGMVVFFRHEDLADKLDEPLNEAVLLKAGETSVEYYFAALWSQEPGGIKTRAEFKVYLDSTVQYLNNPILVMPTM